MQRNAAISGRNSKSGCSLRRLHPISFRKEQFTEAILKSATQTFVLRLTVTKERDTMILTKAVKLYRNKVVPRREPLTIEM